MKRCRLECCSAGKYRKAEQVCDVCIHITIHHKRETERRIVRTVYIESQCMTTPGRVTCDRRERRLTRKPRYTNTSSGPRQTLVGGKGHGGSSTAYTALHKVLSQWDVLSRLMPPTLNAACTKLCLELDFRNVHHCHISCHGDFQIKTSLSGDPTPVWAAHGGLRLSPTYLPLAAHNNSF